MSKFLTKLNERLKADGFTTCSIQTNPANTLACVHVFLHRGGECNVGFGRTLDEAYAVASAKFGSLDEAVPFEEAA